MKKLTNSNAQLLNILIDMKKSFDYENDDGNFAPTDKQIAKESELKSISYRLRVLEDRGLIRRYTAYDADAGRRRRVIEITNQGLAAGVPGDGDISADYNNGAA